MNPPRYLLLPKPGLGPDQLDAFLRGCGLRRVTDLRRGSAQPRLLRWADDRGALPSLVEYREEHTLGQRQIYVLGPRAPELAQKCAAHWPCWSPEEALAVATAASAPPDKVATLAPLAALVADQALTGPQIHAVLSARLADPVLAVRQAALLVVTSLPASERTALLQEVVHDPELAAVAQSYLVPATASEPGDPGDPTATDALTMTQRAEAAVRDGDPGRAGRLLDHALELDPLASPAYLARARLRAADGRVWPALIDVTTALAVARRQGVHLQAMQELQNALRAQLLLAQAPPTVADELQALAQLAVLLRGGRLHEVEEVAETLRPLAGRPPLWWLAIGLARRERGRPERAVEALEEALRSAPELPAARFILGECRRELGDPAGALNDFARLDPVPGERPARPSLLDAYADELLGAQAPWQSREHAFVRVRLLRELGRTAEALLVLKELGEPPAADALLAQGVLLGELAQPAAALAVLERARAALRPEERLLAAADPLGTVELHRAYALVALGDREGAAAALRAVWRLDPERAAAAVADPVLADLAVPPSAFAGYAALQKLAQQGLVHPDFGTDRETVPADADPAAQVAKEALRGQVAELLVAALGALDDHAEEAACRELFTRAWRGLRALYELAPQVVTTHAAALRALLDAAAAAVGVPTPTGDFPAPLGSPAP